MQISIEVQATAPEAEPVPDADPMPDAELAPEAGPVRVSAFELIHKAGSTTSYDLGYHKSKVVHQYGCLKKRLWTKSVIDEALGHASAGQQDNPGEYSRTSRVSDNLTLYPNPFNSRTCIRFDMPEAAHARLTVYNLLGRHVTTLVDGEREQGHKLGLRQQHHTIKTVTQYLLAQSTTSL